MSISLTVKHSKCRDDFLNRVKENARLKKEAKEKGGACFIPAQVKMILILESRLQKPSSSSAYLPHQEKRGPCLFRPRPSQRQSPQCLMSQYSFCWLLFGSLLTVRHRQDHNLSVQPDGALVCTGLGALGGATDHNVALRCQQVVPLHFVECSFALHSIS